MSELATYVPHQGTLRVSGITNPSKCANCAFFWLQRGFESIEFFCIGASANQQAMKAMGILMYKVEHDLILTGKTVAFQPLRFSTDTTNRDSGQIERKDATVWRTIVMARNAK